MTISTTDAAALLGTPVDEIASVTDRDGDTLIVTRDGAQLLRLGEPDGDGKTGLVFAVRPDGRDPADPDAPAYALPVFTPRPEDARAAEAVAEPAEDVNLEDLTKAELVAKAEEAGVDATGTKAEIIGRLTGGTDA